MRKLKILHTNMHRGGWGGQPERILVISKFLSGWGHRVVLAVPRNSTLSKRARAAGLRVFDDLSFPRGFHPLTYLTELRKLKRLMESEEFDIVHTHGSQDTWCAAVAAKLAGIPLVVRTRHNLFPISPHLLNRWLYSRCINAVIGSSEAVRDEFRRNGLFDPESIAVIPPAVDTSRFDPSKWDGRAVRSELKIDANAPLVGMVARLAPEKGHRYFVEAAAIVLRVRPDVAFLIVGEGPMEEKIRDRVRGLGIERSVILTGMRDDVPSVLSALDIFATSTLTESFGVSIMEAMAMELPVVATRVGGVPGFVTDGETGLLVPPKDPEALAGAVLKLLSDGELAERIGKAARACVLQNFTQEKLARATEELYYRLLKERRLI